MDAVDLIGWMLAALSIVAIVWMLGGRAADVRSMLVWLREICRCSTTPTWTSKKWSSACWFHVAWTIDKSAQPPIK